MSLVFEMLASGLVADPTAPGYHSGTKEGRSTGRTRSSSPSTSPHSSRLTSSPPRSTTPWTRSRPCRPPTRPAKYPSPASGAVAARPSAPRPASRPAPRSGASSPRSPPALACPSRNPSAEPRALFPVSVAIAAVNRNKSNTNHDRPNGRASIALAWRGGRAGQGVAGVGEHPGPWRDTAALVTAAAVAPGGVTAVLYDGLTRPPPFNPDDDGDHLPWEPARLRREIAAADAVLFCNSRVRRDPARQLQEPAGLDGGGGQLNGKPAAWINVAVPDRGQGAEDALAGVLGYVGADVVEAACRRIPVDRADVSPDGAISDRDSGPKPPRSGTPCSATSANANRGARPATRSMARRP